uniref:C2H2-type domain-containing protein n=1 Tax=Anopheles merus TaxID=30066 RepID=A0A182VE53_ANOME
MVPSGFVFPSVKNAGSTVVAPSSTTSAPSSSMAAGTVVSGGRRGGGGVSGSSLLDNSSGGSSRRSLLQLNDFLYDVKFSDLSKFLNAVGRYECPRRDCDKNYKDASSLQRHIRSNM